MILIGLVGSLERCDSLIKMLEDKDKTRTNVLLNVNSYILQDRHTLDDHARAERFSRALEKLPRSKRAAVWFFGPLDSPTEARALRAMGAFIWHLEISATVPIDLDDLLVGDGFKSSPLAFNYFEAISETRARYHQAMAEPIPHPRDKKTGGVQ